MPEIRRRTLRRSLHLRLGPSAIFLATGKRSDSTIRSVAGRGGGVIEAPTLVRHGSGPAHQAVFTTCTEPNVCKQPANTYAFTLTSVCVVLV